MTDHSPPPEESIGTVLSRVQGRLRNPAKDASAKLHGRTFRYASLSSILEAVREACVAEGAHFGQTPARLEEPELVIVEETSNEPRSKMTPQGPVDLPPATVVRKTEVRKPQWVLLSIFRHGDRKIVNEMPFIPANSSMTAQGGAIALAKRYAVQAMFGLAGDDDEEGVRERPAQESRGTGVPVTPRPATTRSLSELHTLAEKSEVPSASIPEFIRWGLMKKCLKPDGFEVKDALEEDVQKLLMSWRNPKHLETAAEMFVGLPTEAKGA